MSPVVRDTPRWRTRLALAAGVLLVHLWLLLDGWPGGFSEVGGLTGRGTRTTPTETAVAPPAEPAPTPAPPPPSVMTTTTVRWIAAAPPPAAKQAVARALRPAPRQVEPAPAPTPDPAPASPPERAQTPDAHTPQSPPPLPPVVPEQTDPPDPAGLPQVPPAPTPEAPQPSPADMAAAAGLTRVGVGDALPPGNTLLRYDVQVQSKGLSLSADAELRWEVRGDEYNAKLEISALLAGSRIQTSQGRIGPQGLLPSRFGDRRRRSENAAHFDQEGQLIRFSNNTPNTTLLPGGQDRLSVFLQIGSMLRARPQAFAAGQRITVQVTGTGGADIWSFMVGPLEQLNLPAGTLDAVHLTRLPRREHDQKVELWLAPSLQYLPARIRITDQDGGGADQQLRVLPDQIQ